MLQKKTTMSGISSARTPPLLLVKKDTNTDLFKVYGPSDMEQMSDGDDGDSSGLESMRIKLAVLKAKESEELGHRHNEETAREDISMIGLSYHKIHV